MIAVMMVMVMVMLMIGRWWWQWLGDGDGWTNLRGAGITSLKATDPMEHHYLCNNSIKSLYIIIIITTDIIINININIISINSQKIIHTGPSPGWGGLKKRIVDCHFPRITLACLSRFPRIALWRFPRMQQRSLCLLSCPAGLQPTCLHWFGWSQCGRGVSSVTCE